MTQIAVLLVSPSALFREALAESLDADDNIRVVGTAGDEQNAITLTRDHEPAVVLIGPSFGGRWESLLHALLRMLPALNVVVLADDEAWAIRRLFILGIKACLATRSSRQEVIAVLQAVVSNPDHAVLSTSRQTMRTLGGGPVYPLSDREIEVLTLAAGGASNAEIAVTLHLSVGTVKRHLSNIYTKLGVCSRVAAINAATNAGALRSGASPSA
jgi:DNA-binding NarL/FixJ family response regulator